MDTKEFQKIALESLKARFGNAKMEWDITEHSEDRLNRADMYCPRPDVVVNPLNIRTLRHSFAPEYIKHKQTIEALYNAAINKHSYDSFADFISSTNPNPRCFLAIEIEKSGSRKHRLGDIANAAILGGIGIIIPLDEKVCKSFKKIFAFLDFASKVDKLNAPIFKNTLLIEPDKFLNALEQESNIKN